MPPVVVFGANKVERRCIQTQLACGNRVCCLHAVRAIISCFHQRWCNWKRFAELLWI